MINLAEIPILSGLDRVSLAKLIPNFEELNVNSGEMIFRQGDAGDCLYIILDGIVRVFLDTGVTDAKKGRYKEIACLGARDCFGEMALLSGEPRSADVQAMTDLVLLRLCKERFEQLIEQHASLGVNFAGLLANRLLQTDAVVSGRMRLVGEGRPRPLRSEEQKLIPLHVSRTWSSYRAFSVLKNRKFLSLVLTGFLCLLSVHFLRDAGLGRDQIILVELLLGATVIWTMNLLSYHVIAIALPVLSVLLGAATPERALSGFSSSSWFLVLGVLAISAAIARTGLLYRVVLMIIKRFPLHYAGQAFGLGLSGILLTPIVPSPVGRMSLVSPLVMTLSEILGFKKGDPGAAGLAMSALLGFGLMSPMFMNGAPECFLVLGLFPPEIGSTLTWSQWFKAALPLGASFFLISYLVIITLYGPKEKKRLNPWVIEAQIKVLGPLSMQERISLATAVFFIMAFLTQPWHHVDGAWVAMLAFLILFAASVLDEKAVRGDIDWSFLVSFGALVGYGNIIWGSGLGGIICNSVRPCLEFFTRSGLLFFLVITLAVTLLRFALPLVPCLLVCLLSLLPMTSALGIHPLVVGLVILVSLNPWFLLHQNMMYLILFQNTERRLFDHDQTLKLAFVHIGVVMSSVAVSIPYWRWQELVP